MAVPRLVARSLIQRRLTYALPIRQITTPPPPPPPNPTSTDEPLKPKSLPSLDISPIEAPPPPNTPSDKSSGERTGARSAKDSLSSIEKKRQTFARWTIAFGLAGIIGGAIYMGREWESEEEKKAIGGGTIHLGHLTRRLVGYIDLGCASLPYKSGIHFTNVPVIYSDNMDGVQLKGQTAIPVVEKLDPFGAFILYKLFREATRTTKDGLVKVSQDLNYLNRDLSKVIAIDTDKSKYAENPDNAIVIPKWRADGSSGDPAGLVGLIPFLESIAIHSPPDVRPILKAYQDKDIAKAYAAVEAEQKRKVVEEWEKKRKSGGGSGNMAIGGLFGFGGAKKQHPADQPPLTYLEQRRKEYQDLYKQDQAYWAENSEKFRKMMEEDRERQMKEMGGSLLGWMGMAPPKDPKEQEKKA
ncbi:NIF domain-containing protein [Rhizoctonia solani AG-1 IA]|uniref:Mitochondrial import inner membrane translocase subunit TIM50 n=1 Tax=Thanatephorus cucumeris (strain AG1-IA) TaxID=983506 RepID=L8WZD9_THACA|nr:NIF domain-containing protein [Rhizoctonia solani AG-1 IA]